MTHMISRGWNKQQQFAKGKAFLPYAIIRGMYEFFFRVLSLDINVAGMSSAFGCGRIQIRPDQRQAELQEQLCVCLSSPQLCIAEAGAAVRRPISGLRGEAEEFQLPLPF